MRKHIAAGFVAIIIGLMAGTAEAQSVVYAGPPVYVNVPTVSATTTYSSQYVAPQYVAPYSYYVVRSGPARIYVGYGDNDYPFYGQPYGKPTDPWSWQYLSGSYIRDLSRYYYPPVR